MEILSPSCYPQGLSKFSFSKVLKSLTIYSKVTKNFNYISHVTNALFYLKVMWCVLVVSSTKL